MIRKSLLLRIFDAAYMQRWNDKLRPIELVELDKQGHKMIIAYILGKFEENKNGFNWIEVIEGG
ncbi:MAG TPA: hydrolase, partial [Methanofastidiosum sp.]|nr:hydrolase [Methanofastidiosum sp.]